MFGLLNNFVNEKLRLCVYDFSMSDPGGDLSDEDLMALGEEKM